MVLDMESEFYKIAKNILGTPKNFHKLLAVSPRGRLAMMGADGGVMVSDGMLGMLIRSNPDKAYRYAKKSAKDIFGALVKEFDEEVENLPPEKKFELAVGLARATGWGEIEVVSFNGKRFEGSFKVTKALESSMKEDHGSMLTSGYVAGLGTVAFGADMDCTSEREGGAVLLRMARAKA
jgi:hypothetical protein